MARFLHFSALSICLALGCSKAPGGDADSASVSLQCEDPLEQAELTLDPDEVHLIVEANMQTIRYCYERALDTNPMLQGQVEVQLVIEEDGTPSSGCSGESSMSNQEVVSCVLSIFSQFRFHEQETQVATIYPLAFSYE